MYYVPQVVLHKPSNKPLMWTGHGFLDENGKTVTNKSEDTAAIYTDEVSHKADPNSKWEMCRVDRYKIYVGTKELEDSFAAGFFDSIKIPVEIIKKELDLAMKYIKSI